MLLNHACILGRDHYFIDTGARWFISVGVDTFPQGMIEPNTMMVQCVWCGLQAHFPLAADHRPK